MKNYIFGYGSLIEKESRLRTTPQASIIFPANVYGFQRGWFARIDEVGLSTTYLGCIESAEAHTNGVIYEVTEDDLLKTDAREKSYRRQKINWENIQDFSGEIDTNSNVWIYLNEFKNNSIPNSCLPSNKYPIVQSYVDICINGCLEVESLFPMAKENNFTIEFIKSTNYWSKYWVNDRIYPRRPFIFRHNAYEIDRILKDNLLDKTIFENIYFE